jgi:hypothetical protein
MVGVEIVDGAQRRPAYNVPLIFGRAPPDLRFRGPLEAQSSVGGPQLDPPDARGTVFDLKYRFCGRDRRCKLSLAPGGRQPPRGKVLLNFSISRMILQQMASLGPPKPLQRCWVPHRSGDLGADRGHIEA